MQFHCYVEGPEQMSQTNATLIVGVRASSVGRVLGRYTSFRATYQFRTGSNLPSDEIFSECKRNKSVGMYVVWLSPAGYSGFTGISRDLQMCSGLPPPQAALVTVASGEKGPCVVWCNSGGERFRIIGRGILIGMITDLWLLGGGH